MGKASSRKKVARAASTGGGRTSRAGKNTQLGWYAGLTLIIVLGLALVVLSTQDRRQELAGSNKPPLANQDHWHSAYGFYICDKFATPASNDNDPVGIHTHKLVDDPTAGDGVIHVHPFTPSAAGENAIMEKFAEAAGFKLSENSITLPDGKTYKNGDKCGSKEGTVQFVVNGKPYNGDPNKIRFADRQLITIAFVPSGTKVPEPNSKAQLDNLSDVSPVESPGSENPGQSSATITVPVGSAPSSAVPTTAPAGQ